MAQKPAASGHPCSAAEACYLHKFRLYETQSNFYMVGRDKHRKQWSVLKIDRLEPSELNILEDAVTYSERECHDLLKRINEGNRPTGGLRFVTNCYGIVGFVRFLGPYYMLLITKRRQIGTICGHTIYTASKSELIALANSTFQLDLTNSKNEKRYKKLLRTVDLTKDFFFSYSYNVMRSLQKNFCESQTGHVVYDSMFVWNEFLTRGIRNRLRNNVWTVALVHGFFKQVNLSMSGKDLKLIVIARRSRHYAGTRGEIKKMTLFIQVFKTGVNEKGRVANDVETEQIVFEDIPGYPPTQICSVVQHRGSIPLYWSQENSWLNPKPSIILHRKEQSYEAARLHFENLVERYGNPIIILNLIKTREKKPRESILREEFANAIDFINKGSSQEDQLRFLHWDLQKHLRNQSVAVLPYLGRIAAYALNLTGIFYCQLSPSPSIEDAINCPTAVKDDAVDFTSWNGERGEGILQGRLLLQNGVLRTNCIDCLDRTNVAQYAYGLAGLGQQLHELGLIDVAEIDLASPLADDLANLYEMMGDTLAIQYGGSGAHNQIFCEKRGQWKASIQSQELFRIIQRYYSNTYVDAEKQDAINLFLGHFQPQQSKPALWELGSDQLYNIGRRDHNFADENSRLSLKRSLSDGNISSESDLLVSTDVIGQKKPIGLNACDSTPDISPCDRSISNSKYGSPVMHRRVFWGNEDSSVNEHGTNSSTSSNFLHFDWLPSSGLPWRRYMIGDDLVFGLCALVNSSAKHRSAEDAVGGAATETTPNLMEDGTTIEEVRLRWEVMAAICLFCALSSFLK
ncbi:unnamed protein product [Spirodela intermedia]|uniref:SAC domain-containing protein n=1 Tax=Spirodela intermedia TaxID=51605 RepID=A0A7I8IL92_SPIIN|nr:unnamed protein product [Spirodela intermedia]CAA6658701.1 unnamed protein product [Spirodela intermedia]